MPVPHRWDISTKEARDVQLTLASQVDTSAHLRDWSILAAADVSFARFDKELAAAVVLLDRENLQVVERVGIIRPITFPYVPGLLSFREIPGLLDAFEQIKHGFDVVLCDGQGIAHPRRVGIASHLGLCLDKPTVGCAKSRLIGSYIEPGPTRGEQSPLIVDGEIVGTVVRTRDRIKPLFVSPGHKCNLASAVDLVLATTRKYRLPIPARLAHEYVNEVRRTNSKAE